MDDVLHEGARLLVQEVVAHVGEAQQQRDRVEKDELYGWCGWCGWFWDCAFMRMNKWDARLRFSPTIVDQWLPFVYTNLELNSNSPASPSAAGAW